MLEDRFDLDDISERIISGEKVDVNPDEVREHLRECPMCCEKYFGHLLLEIAEYLGPVLEKEFPSYLLGIETAVKEKVKVIYYHLLDLDSHCLEVLNKTPRIGISDN